MSSLPGSFTGEGTPWIPADRAHAGVEVEDLAQATLIERIPPPTGVVSGPLMPTR